MSDKKLKPEIVAKSKANAPEIVLKRNECLVEILDGNDKGEIFKTNIRTAESIYSDEKKFKIVKKK